ncbi:MAG: hypothetical protein J6W77_03375, partial [Prevotella sp.]|nr:hypothetical protein [Prevotella sp.]
MTNDRITSKFLHILAVGNRSVEEVLQEEEQRRNQQTQNDGNEVIHHIARGYPNRSFQTSLVKNFVIWGIGST